MLLYKTKTYNQLKNKTYSFCHKKNTFIRVSYFIATDKFN